MLNRKDFHVALSKAPECSYIDHAWPVYEKYCFVDTEVHLVIFAPKFLIMGGSDETERAHRLNEAVHDAGEEEVWSSLQEYFRGNFRGDAEEKFKEFLTEFFHRTDEAVEEPGKHRLDLWLEEEHSDLDEAMVEYLYDSVADILDEVDEHSTDWLSRLYLESLDIFKEHGQELMFERLRELCKGIDQVRRESLIAKMRGDLEKGMNVSDAMGRVVTMDKAGLATPGPFAKQVLFELKQDLLSKLKSKLIDLLYYNGSPHSFYPFRTPGLFLDFAELGEKEAITEGDVMQWVHSKGLLGLGLEDANCDVESECRGGPKETISAFTREAREARALRRIYEAALSLESEDEGTVRAAIEELEEFFDWSDEHHVTVWARREKALEAVRLQVQGHLDKHCFIRWRRAGNGFVEFLDFKNIVGAMYLQFAWVLRENADLHRCRYCGTPIGNGAEEEQVTSNTEHRKTHKNKRTCGKPCREAYNNKRNRTSRQEVSLRFSVPSTTEEQIEFLAAERAISTDKLLRDMVRVYEEHSVGKRI